MFKRDLPPHRITGFYLISRNLTELPRHDERKKKSSSLFFLSSSSCVLYTLLRLAMPDRYIFCSILFIFSFWPFMCVYTFSPSLSLSFGCHVLRPLVSSRASTGSCVYISRETRRKKKKKKSVWNLDVCSLQQAQLSQKGLMAGRFNDPRLQQSWKFRSRFCFKSFSAHRRGVWKCLSLHRTDGRTDFSRIFHFSAYSRSFGFLLLSRALWKKS